MSYIIIIIHYRTFVCADDIHYMSD